MFAYIIRRTLYAIPILLGVNVILFVLFFSVNPPRSMAETHINDPRVNEERITDWLREHDYDYPNWVNTAEPFPKCFTQTVFWKKNMTLFAFQFGKSDADDTSIGREILRRIPYSLAITIPAFLLGLFINVVVSMLVAFYRGTYVDAWALVLCVLMMSISAMFYIIGGQWLIANRLKLVPVSGFLEGMSAIKFIVLPIVISLISGLGSSVRYNRTIFLEEISKDYIRTARAKGLGENAVLFKHALKNAMIPILTSVVVSIPFLIMGSLLFERFFGIPGLGRYLIEAIQKQDFSVVRAMVFLNSVLYVFALLCVDISYTLVDPRIRLK